MRKGRIFLLTSAIIYGLVPVLANQVYKSGGDGVTLVLLRSALSLPLLLAIILYKKIGLNLSKKELLDSIVVSFFGSAPSMVFLVSLLTTLVAIPFFQRGVELEGATEAGIISMAEPVVSVMSGLILFGESITLAGGIGCVFIALGIWLVEG